MDQLPGLAFCTLGMFILDDIDYLQGKPPLKNVIGGAGTYAALGARLVAGRRCSSSVGWIVDIGSDFPEGLRSLIEAWATSCVIRVDRQRLTTRGWNGYGPNEIRAFRYTTPKLRLDEWSLSDAQIWARSFHMVCSSVRCVNLVKGILARRRSLASSDGDIWRPLFIWEPVGDLCKPEEIANFKLALEYVDVVSPNADELAGFFHKDGPLRTQESTAHEVCSWQSEARRSGQLIVREGADGCTLYGGSWQCHLPAFFPPHDAFRVADPTGGGNTFLGALAMALSEACICIPLSRVADGILSAGQVPVAEAHEFRRHVAAATCATIAASFAIQQCGMPELSMHDAEEELWNGCRFTERLDTYIERENKSIQEGIIRR